MSYRLENGSRKLTREELLGELSRDPQARFWIGGGDLSEFLDKAFTRRNGEPKIPEYMQPVEPVEKVVFKRAPTERVSRSRRNHSRGTRGKKK